MLRTLDGVLEQLRKPRYLALSAVMLLVAGICVAAGTWQVFRFVEKRHANALLRHNAHAARAPVGTVLGLTSAAEERSRNSDARFRQISAQGTYLADRQVVVRERTVDSTVGFLVLTPLRTAIGPWLLVVRGFVAADGNTPTAIAAPPVGQVTITGRVQEGEWHEDMGNSPAGQVKAINPEAWARRTGEAVYAGYVELLATQPGTSGLTTIPAPDLSNPAGGAVEPQHAAYVLQWYLFALLALAAPLVMARAESRRPDTDGAGDFGAAGEPVDAVRAAHASKMADRYGGARAR